VEWKEKVADPPGVSLITPFENWGQGAEKVWDPPVEVCPVQHN
jgi:hypothetical protein